MLLFASGILVGLLISLGWRKLGEGLDEMAWQMRHHKHPPQPPL